VGRWPVHKDEDGLTLVEMMVAMVVVGLVLMAMASVAIASMNSIQQSERTVLSTQLGNDLLEEYLAVRYEFLGLYQDEANDHFNSTAFEGDDLVLFPEPINRDERVPEPRDTITRDGVTFEVETAIVWEDDEETESAQDFKRVIVTLTWQHKGSDRTARVETLRTPDPDDQPLSVRLEPDVIALEDDDLGKATTNFSIHVTATEPQSAVKVSYLDRNGTKRTAQLNSTDPWDTEWSRTFDNNSTERRFTNGATLFEVTATSQSSEQETTTIGRALFLHPLSVPSNRLTATPSTLRVHPETGVCSGLNVTTEIRGAVKSDPLTLSFEGDEPEDALPMESLATLTDGTRYGIDLEASELPVVHGESPLRFYLELDRAADGAVLDPPQSVDVPVQSLDEDQEC
jgi:prepilin-type N-terminal cleavage/methylation domain-containing protein